MSNFFDLNQILGLEMRDYLGKYLTTGAPSLDMLIGVAIIQIISYTSVSAQHYVNEVSNFMMRMLSGFSLRRKGQIEFVWEPNQGASLGYNAIAFKLARIKDTRVKQLREVLVTFWNEGPRRYDTEAVFECLQSESIEVVPGVYVRTQEQEPSNTSRDSGKVVLRRTILYSSIMDATALKALTQDWIAEYKEFRKNELEAERFIFTVRFQRKKEAEIDHSAFHTFRNFDNLHFDFKEQCLEELDFFQNNEAWFSDRGIPHTFGILCHGPPGCGKTSFIKALLKKTNRHAIVFSLNAFSDLSFIEKLMRTDRIKEYEIPQRDRIYVMEDVDAMGNLVKRRDERKSEPLSSMPNDNFPEHADAKDMWGLSPVTEDVAKLQLKFLLGLEDKNESHHLASLLNLLDGVVEVPGRIVVMTTNYVDKLDPALIRPGRINLSLKFSRCSRELLRKFCGQFYDVDPQSIAIPDDIKDGILTPARVVQICRGNRFDMARALSDIAVAAKEETLKIKRLSKDESQSFHSNQNFINTCPFLTEF